MEPGPLTRTLRLSEIEPGLLLDPRTFAKWLPRLGANYGINYVAIDPETQEPTPDAVKARLLFERLLANGWTAKQFEKRVGEFVDSHDYPNWKTSEFIDKENIEPVSLHPYSWYITKVDEYQGNADAIACYETEDGAVGWGWTHELDGLLERRPLTKVEVYRATLDEAPGGPPSDELSEKLKSMSLALEVADLGKQLEKSKRESSRADGLVQRIADLQTELGESAEAIDGYCRLLDDLAAGRVTVEQLRRLWVVEDREVAA